MKKTTNPSKVNRRATYKGRSAEEEHREAALSPANARRSLKELLLAMPPGGEDKDFERVSD